MRSGLPTAAAALLIMALGTSCRRDMADQAHHEPLEASAFFADGAASRPLPAHTVARGQLREDEELYTGHAGRDFATNFPKPVTRAVLERGRERYDIFCSVCHGLTGDGRGMIVERGFPPPPTLHQERLRTAPPGYIFQVITQGYGVMYPYASRVSPEDRWAITAYIRALQLSQNAMVADADAGARAKLEEIER